MLQSDIATHLGITRQAYNHYETGRRSPDPEALKKLAKFYDVTVDYLLGIPKTYNFAKGGHQSPALVPVLEKIRADAPLLADGHIGGYELANVKNPDDYFFLRATGDSMIDAGILPESIVLIRKQNCAETGDIVACLVDGENATLKRFKQTDNRITLIPANSHYDPIILTIDDFDSGYAKILGVAISVTTKL